MITTLVILRDRQTKETTEYLDIPAMITNLYEQALEAIKFHKREKWQFLFEPDHSIFENTIKHPLEVASVLGLEFEVRTYETTLK